MILLNVPYSEKEIVKALGARWHKQLKMWYIESHWDIEPFKPWLVTNGSVPINVTVHQSNNKKKRIQISTNPIKPKRLTQNFGITIGKNFTEAYIGDEPPWE